MDMEMDKSVSAGPWRSLSAAEIEALEAGGNSCRDWSLLRVSGQEFRPERVRGCRFSGTVRSVCLHLPCPAYPSFSAQIIHFG